MSKLLISPARMDGNLKSRNKSRTRLRRLETKEKHATSLNVGAADKPAEPNTKEDSHIEPISNSKAITSVNQADSLNESLPLNVSHDDPENDEFAGLRLCSQDEGLNQSGERDECEVRWDCYSPHTVKQLKKLRGQYNAEGVKQIVANFNDAHVKPVESSGLKLLPLPGPGPSAPFKEIKLPHRFERLANKKPRRLTSQKAVQEMILLLQKKNSKREKGQETQTPPSTAEVSSTRQTESDAITNRDNTTTTTERTTKEESEDCWSDDDLFQDNSFLIEATQNPEKFINTSFDMSTKGCRAKVLHCDNQKSIEDPVRCDYGSPDSSFIPPSFALKKTVANKSSLPVSSSCAYMQGKLHPNKISNALVKNALPDEGTANGGLSSCRNQVEKDNKSPLSSQNIKLCKPSKTNNAKFTSSVNKFANRSSSKASSNNAAQNISKSPHWGLKSSAATSYSLPQSQVKASFRKLHSFQAGTKPSSLGSSTGNSCAEQNNCFMRTMSFDRSQSAGPGKCNMQTSVISSNKSNNKCNKPLLTEMIFTNKPSASNSSNWRTAGRGSPQTRNSSGKTKPNQQCELAIEDGFDISLTEDVLQQLLQVDEVFDSQADILATGQPSEHTVPTSACQKSKVSPPTNKILNPLSAASVRVSSLRSNTPVRPFKQRRSLIEPSSSTPVKIAKASPTGTKETTASDSGTELFDSFLNEDVYESQILPFLEKIESETKAASAKSTLLPSTSPVKCSPEEIEQKRQAALQRRSVRLSQSRSIRTNSWR